MRASVIALHANALGVLCSFFGSPLSLFRAPITISFSRVRAVTNANRLSRMRMARHPGRVRFIVTDAEDLAFKNAAFDRAVATCVFCSVPDPVHGLREAGRVLRPNGQIILLEHMRPGGFRGKLFDLLDPLMSRMMGPHINRQTTKNVQEADLQLVEERNIFSDWVKVIVARPQEGK